MALAPTKEMIQLASEGKTNEFASSYNEQILSWLDPKKVYSELDGCILLSCEKSGRFSHRKLVAEWLEQATGNKVLEFGHDS